MVREDLFVTLAEVIARLEELSQKSTIYAESPGPSARAYVTDGSGPTDESLPYAFDVAAVRSAFAPWTPDCPWRRRVGLSRRA
jgi:hypothetical protein